MILIVASLFLETPLSLQKRALIAPPPHLEYFSFGQQMVIADSLWIRAIQDFDYCEVQKAKNVCQGNSWLYQMLETLTNLAPDYLQAYRDGALALSVVISDTEGSSKIFDKGVRLFQSDFDLLYRAAYHALYEEKNKVKAAQIFARAAKLQGAKGDWLYSLATRLYVDGGEQEVGMRLYQEMKDSGLEESFLKRMREKLGIKDE